MKAGRACACFAVKQNLTFPQHHELVHLQDQEGQGRRAHPPGKHCLSGMYNLVEAGTLTFPPQAVYELQVNSDKLRQSLRQLHITSAKVRDVQYMLCVYM